jgi:hypothetical protein
MNITRVSKGAAREQSGWITIVRNHPLIAEALTKASISDSYGKQFATWNNRLEKEEQEGADQILIEAALAGLSWDDLARVAQEMFERSKVVPDDDDGDAPFRDRDGWQITVHADGTVTARAPWGTVLRTNDTVAA